MIKEIYIIRHAETIADEREIILGRSPKYWDLEALSEIGEKQIDDLVEKFGNKKINEVWSGNSSRAINSTVNFIDKLQYKSGDYYTDCLNERGFGNLEGKTLEEAGVSYDAYLMLYKANTGKNIFSDVESLEHIHRRVNSIKDAINKSNAQTIVIMGHEWINSYLISTLLGENFLKKFFQTNCQVSYIKLDEKGKVLEFEFDKKEIV